MHKQNDSHFVDLCWICLIRYHPKDFNKEGNVSTDCLCLTSDTYTIQTYKLELGNVLKGLFHNLHTSLLKFIRRCLLALTFEGQEPYLIFAL